MPLAAARANLEEARGLGGEPLAAALVELAEAEPLLGHRQRVVRALLEEAAAQLDGLAAPALEGRVLLRLAHLKLTEQDLEGAEQLATRARERLESAGDRDRQLEAASVLARAAIRRHDFGGAEARLIAAAEAVDEDRDGLSARRAATALAFAWVELALEQQDWDTARARLDVLAPGVDDDDELIEQQFASRQVRAVVALALGQADRACHALREVVALAKRLEAAEDEVEARIALAGALVERGDAVGREEAERHLQVSRDLALDGGLDALHTAALIGQAGLLAKKGNTQAALDRCLEIAQVAVSKQDLERYTAAVTLMSQIYEQRGDVASAYRTLAEAHATLRDTIGDQATALFRPHLRALADRLGPELFRKVADQVNKAAAAHKSFRRS